MRAKYLIVGGGVMGTSIAMNLARRSDPLTDPVVLIERTEVGAGTSSRSAAILRHVSADRVLVAMARDSLREFAHFQARTGRSVGFRRTGVLTLVGPDQREKRERLAQIGELLHELAVEAWPVGAAEAREVFPGIEVAEGSYGIWEPGGGVFDPTKTIQSFAALARSYGAVVQPGVEACEPVFEGSRLVGVETSGGTYRADFVIVAAGIWTRSLLESWGAQLPLEVERRESHYVETPQGPEEDTPDIESASPATGFIRLEHTVEELVARHEREMDGRPATHPVLVDLERGAFIRCEPRLSRTRVGRIDPSESNGVVDVTQRDETVSPGLRNWARELLEARLPDYRGQADLSSQVSWYTATPDGRPFLGPLPGSENIYAVAGFSGHGFKLAPAVGLGLAQMLLGEPVSAFDPAFFSPARLAQATAAPGTRPFEP